MNIMYTGDVLIVVSSLKFKDIQVLENRAPDELKLRSADGEVEFAVGTAADPSISEFGVEFTHANANGFAMADIGWQSPKEDVPQAIVEEFGNSLSKLGELEERIAAIDPLARVYEEDERLKAVITVF